MGRPSKQTVEYFPHYNSDGKTLFIVESKWGNDGYALWFKLLEILSRTEGHIYDCNSVTNWEYLCQKCRLSAQAVTEILNILGELEAIDKPLWEKRIIWCQNLVNNLKPVYDKRHQSLPAKKIPVTERGAMPQFPAQAVTERGAMPPIKKSRVKKSRVYIEQEKIVLPDSIDGKLWDDFLEMRRVIKRPATPQAQKLILEKLERSKAAGDDPNEMLKKSIVNNWQDVYEPKKEGGNNGRTGTHTGNESKGVFEQLAEQALRGKP